MSFRLVGYSVSSSDGSSARRFLKRFPGFSASTVRMLRKEIEITMKKPALGDKDRINVLSTVSDLFHVGGSEEAVSKLRQYVAPALQSRRTGVTVTLGKPARTMV